MQFDQLRRREFITLLGGAAAWSLYAHARRPAAPVIGFVNGAAADVYPGRAAAFPKGLEESGYVEGCSAFAAMSHNASQTSRRTWSSSRKAMWLATKGSSTLRQK
jgi:hypothetical protein